MLDKGMALECYAGIGLLKKTQNLNKDKKKKTKANETLISPSKKPQARELPPEPVEDLSQEPLNAQPEVQSLPSGPPEDFLLPHIIAVEGQIIGRKVSNWSQPILEVHVGDRNYGEYWFIDTAIIACRNHGASKITLNVSAKNSTNFGNSNNKELVKDIKETGWSDKW